jgi:nitroreductase
LPKRFFPWPYVGRRTNPGIPIDRPPAIQRGSLFGAAASAAALDTWGVYLLTGKEKDALSEAITRAYHTNTTPPFSPFPQPMPADCAARADEFARRYYSALGIDRSDMTVRARQIGRNYVFFDAPVGLIFTTHATLTKHSWLDCGLFLQSLMLAAYGRGLATCPQVSFVRFQSVIAKQLNLGPMKSLSAGCHAAMKNLMSAFRVLQTSYEATSSRIPSIARRLSLTQ